MKFDNEQLLICLFIMYNALVIYSLFIIYNIAR